jgi:phage protein Gp37/Gp68
MLSIPTNVWLGTTIENQAMADLRIPILLSIPARVHFLSCEPLLESVDISRWLDRTVGGRFHAEPIVSWTIAGGESGPRARPTHLDWARSLRDQCQEAGTAFFWKQWGEWLPWSQFTAAGIDDDPEQTRFQTMEWEDGRWKDVGRPMWCDTEDGHIDDEQCVGRVGKSRAGALLDSREWREFPA